MNGSGDDVPSISLPKGGTPSSFGTDPGVIADPADRARVFAWKLTRTQDPFGNRIEYEYQRDTGDDGTHHDVCHGCQTNLLKPAQRET